ALLLGLQAHRRPDRAAQPRDGGRAGDRERAAASREPRAALHARLQGPGQPLPARHRAAPAAVLGASGRAARPFAPPSSQSERCPCPCPCPCPFVPAEVPAPRADSLDRPCPSVPAEVSPPQADSLDRPSHCQRRDRAGAGAGAGEEAGRMTALRSTRSASYRGGRKGSTSPRCSGGGGGETSSRAV